MGVVELLWANRGVEFFAAGDDHVAVFDLDVVEFDKAIDLNQVVL
jgi:hypothetical protein